MKKNIRSKINRFLESEDGRVSTKAPLTLGIATGSVLLAQAMVPSAAQANPIIDDSGVTCEEDTDCTVEIGEICDFNYETYDPGPTIVITSECIIPDC